MLASMGRNAHEKTGWYCGAYQASAVGEDAVGFCQRFGGVATAHDNISLDNIIEAYQNIEDPVCDDFGSHAGIIFRKLSYQKYSIGCRGLKK